MSNGIREIWEIIYHRFNLQEDKAPETEVIEAIKRDADFRGANLLVLMLAIIIASVGLNVNSTAVIIGAMLISPLMGPIMGVGLGIGINDFQLIKRSFKNYGFSVLVSLVTSAVYFKFSPLGDAHSELLSRTTPTIWDVLIAFAGGLAGIIAATGKSKGNVIPGVAIATALMPPLCTAGFGLAHLQWNIFLGAFYLFIINSVFISIAALLIVRLLKFRPVEYSDEKTRSRVKRMVWVVVIVTVLPSIYMAYVIVVQNQFTTAANSFITNETVISDNYLLDKKVDVASKTIFLVYAGKGLTQEQKDHLKSRLSIYNLEKAKLQINEGFTLKSLLPNTTNNESQKYLLAMQEKQKEVDSLRNTIDSINQMQVLKYDLYNEAKTEHPMLTELALMPIYNDPNNKDTTVHYIAYSRFTKTPDKQEINRLQNWVQVRTKSKKIKLIVDK